MNVPPQTSNTANQWSDLKVTVFSCDLYCDMWPLFFHFFFKLWPDAPTPIYLVTNHLSYDDPRVISVKVGTDESWTDGAVKALRQIPSEYICFFLDDFMLTKPIDVPRLEQAFSLLKQQNGNWLCFSPVAQPPESDPAAIISPVLDPKHSGGFHAGIWRRSYLEELCSNQHLNIWTSEGLIRKKIRAGEAKGMFYLTKNSPWLASYIEVIKRFWQKNGIEYMRANNIKPDFWRRPYPPQGDDFFSRFIRSLLKRYVRMKSAAETKRLLKKSGGVVSSAVRFIKPEN